MITASRSSRLTADATPAPSALRARSISSSARASFVAQRVVPDARGEPVLAALLHDLEQVGLDAVVVLVARLRLHRPAARVGLHAAAPTARTARAAALDHHVADLAGRPAADPALAVEDQAAADPGAPEDAEDRVVGLAGAELELGVRWRRRRRWRPGPGRRAPLRASSRAGSCRPSRAGCRASETSPVCSLELPGEPTPTPASESVCTPAASAASISACAISWATSAGPPLVGVWRRASPRPPRPG